MDSRYQSVMVVDDNEDTAAALAAMLTTAGHQVSVAHDALQALSLIARVRPTVVLLDIGLPVMDGVELATRIRREFGINAPRVIAVTGYDLEQDRARSREIGFELHLVKPVVLETLVAAVDAHASPARSR
ncbi:MAG: response regulator [Burkholderiales bacterium]